MALELRVWADPTVPFADEADETEFLTDIVGLAQRHGFRIGYEVAEVADQ